jgi:hypothetical protein
MKLALIISACLIISGCKENSARKRADFQRSELQNIPDSSAQIENAIGEIKIKIDKIKSELNKMSVESSDSCFSEYYGYLKSVAIPSISDLAINILDKYGNYAGDTASLTDKDKNTLKNLSSVGLKILYEGEGMASLNLSISFISELFKGRLSEPLSELLNILNDEDSRLYSSDGGILLPFDSIGLRIHNWEEYLLKYPEGKYSDFAKNKMNGYLADFMVGEENTPTFQDSTILPEILNIYSNYVVNHPGSNSSQLISKYIEAINLNGGRYSEALRLLTPSKTGMAADPF